MQLKFNADESHVVRHKIRTQLDDFNNDFVVITVNIARRDAERVYAWSRDNEEFVVVLPGVL
jgi:hypothetical protein